MAQITKAFIIISSSDSYPAGGKTKMEPNSCNLKKSTVYSSLQCQRPPHGICRRDFIVWLAKVAFLGQGMAHTGCSVNEGHSLVANSIVRVAFQTDKEIVHNIVPAPLKANDGGLMYAFIGRFNTYGFMYHQAGLGVPVSCELRESGSLQMVNGSYFDKWYDNNQQSQSLGKKVWGYPKQWAEVIYNESKRSIDGAVMHDGKQIAEFNFVPSGKEASQRMHQHERHFNFIGQRHFNFKERGKDRFLTVTRWTNVKEREHTFGEAKVQPFGIDVRKVLSATHTVTDWVVPDQPNLTIRNL